MRLSNRGLSPYELTAALRHILEAHQQHRRDHPPKHVTPTTLNGTSHRQHVVGRLVGRETSTSDVNKSPNVGISFTGQGFSTDSEDGARLPCQAAKPEAFQRPPEASPGVNKNTAFPVEGNGRDQQVSDGVIDDEQRKGKPERHHQLSIGRRVRFGDNVDGHQIVNEEGHTPEVQPASDPAVAASVVPECGDNERDDIDVGHGTVPAPASEKRDTTLLPARTPATKSDDRRPTTRFSGQDWCALERDLMRFCHKVLGRLVLRGALQLTAVDQELINNQAESPDKLVARAHQHANHGSSESGQGGWTSGASSSAVTAAGKGTGYGLSSAGNVSQFYLQVLVDTFEGTLPSARRGEEQLEALAGKH